VHYWLLKSEPDTFGIEDLERNGQTEWSGVRNYQARNFMKTMKQGDLCFFYHSNAKPPGIVGICQVSREAYPDFTAFDSQSEYFDPRATIEKPIWEMVDVRFVERFQRLIALDELRNIPELEEMYLTRKGQRLSVQPVTTQEWQAILLFLHAG
jgi:predicted RNA-binding protein with PUA-like domain